MLNFLIFLFYTKRKTIVGAQIHLRMFPPILTKRAFEYFFYFDIGISRLIKSKKFDKALNL